MPGSLKRRTRRPVAPGLAGAAAVLLLGVGCATSANRPEEPLEFPPPPAKARLRYVQWIASPEDVDIGGGLLGWLSGQEVGFSRPYAVVAEEGLPTLIADPGLGVVHVLDAEEDEYRVLSRAGDAPFQMPVALARDPLGRIYVADSAAGKVYCLSSKGELRWVADDLERPAGLALDPRRRRLYVADAGAHTIRLYDLQGRPSKVWGHRGSAPGEFNYPAHLAVDRRGRLYVSDTLNFRVQILSAEGTFLGTLGRAGDSTGDMSRPKGVAVDNRGHIYVADALFDAVQIFDAEGKFLLSVGSPGSGFAEFALPAGVWIDPQDRIYVADSYNQRVQVFQFLDAGGNR